MGFGGAEMVACRQASSCLDRSRETRDRDRDKDRNQHHNVARWCAGGRRSKTKVGCHCPGTGSALSRCRRWEAKVKKLGEPTPPHHLLSAGTESVIAAETKHGSSS